MDGEQAFIDNLQTALIATGAFSDVWVTGLPEDVGQPASDLAAAGIDPVTTSLVTGWDAAPAGGLDMTCQVLVTVLARHSDPAQCDRLVRQLVNQVRNTVNGQTIVPGFNVPQKTRVTGWRWLPRTPPERRVACTVTYDYLEAGWNNADVS